MQTAIAGSRAGGIQMTGFGKDRLCNKQTW